MTIDWWTLGIQAVNVIILVWLLARFFWRPVAAMIEQRRATAQQILTEAEAKRSRANRSPLAEIERTRAGFDKERQAIIDRGPRSRGTGAHGDACHRPAAEAAALETSAEGGDRERARRRGGGWTVRAQPAGGRNRQAPGRPPRCPAVSAAFLDWLLLEIRKLPENVRKAATRRRRPCSKRSVRPRSTRPTRTGIGNGSAKRWALTRRSPSRWTPR